MRPPPALAAIRDRLRTWLLRDAFPLWWSAGADHAFGGFHDRLDLSGAPVVGPKRARVQTRQSFCYSAAPDLGWDGPWLEAMRHGLAFTLDRHRRHDGLYRAWADAGDPRNERVDLYDQAFVLLALAGACRRGEARAAPAAEALLARLPPDPLGGFRELDGVTLCANPNMHLFEAFLAWAEVSADPIWRTLARGQARLALTRLIDAASGALSEIFASDWRPPQAPAHRRVEPGHLFEWAWLLMRWSVLDGDAEAVPAALRLIDLGEGAGVDQVRGVVINRLDGALRPMDTAARLWPQTERLKAALLAGRMTGGERFWTAAERSAEGLLRYLQVATPGLWRDTLAPSGAFVEEPAPASSFYHIVGAILELDRAVG